MPPTCPVEAATVASAASTIGRRQAANLDRLQTPASMQLLQSEELAVSVQLMSRFVGSQIQSVGLPIDPTASVQLVHLPVCWQM